MIVYELKEVARYKIHKTKPVNTPIDWDIQPSAFAINQDGGNNAM